MLMILTQAKLEIILKNKEEDMEKIIELIKDLDAEAQERVIRYFQEKQEQEGNEE